MNKIEMWGFKVLYDNYGMNTKKLFKYLKKLIDKLKDYDYIVMEPDHSWDSYHYFLFRKKDEMEYCLYLAHSVGLLGFEEVKEPIYVPEEYASLNERSTA